MANFDDLFTTPTATETQSDRPQLTKEEYAAKKKAERDSLYALADEMAQEVMRDGEAFRGFLDVQARFDRYSATNALLIYAQNDEATRLRDFDGWKKQGVYVRRHETGISILEAGRDLDGLLGIGNQNFIGHRISPLLSGLVVFRDVQPCRMP